MSETQPPTIVHPFQNRSMHLPSEVHMKKSLKEEIQAYLNELRQSEGNQSKIETLALRRKLIDSHGLSLQRIDNLQAIFLHYCSHIFKTGKHMTFQRLQYQKSHLTMDRFFVFLKDFGLTVGKIDGLMKQVIDKNEIVLMFKRVSVNAKDLNFEQFISCLEKIGLIYYDSMLTYNQRQNRMAEERRKRKETYLKSMRRRKAALEAVKGRAGKGDPDSLLRGEDAEDNENKKTEQGDNEQEQAMRNKPKKAENEITPSKTHHHAEQNHKSVEVSSNDKDLEPNQQPGEAQLENLQKEPLENSEKIQHSQEILQKSDHEHEEHNPTGSVAENKDHLLQLTPEQKIEYFYQLINVDNAASFKKKMRELNLPLFQTKHHRNLSHAQRPSELPKQPRQEETPKDPPVESDEQKRLQQLRNKIEERKERDRGSVPQISKQDYEQRRRRREKEEAEAAVVVRRDPRKKKVDLSELQIDLSSLSNMAHENINFHRFNPQKLIQATEEEDPYLEEYTSGKKTQRSQKRILSTFEGSDGRSQVMLDKMKKRAQEIEIRQRNAESKYSSNSQALVSTDHLLRKNRLVQKLMKIYKQ